MQTEPSTRAYDPIIEPWRIAALVLIIVVAMLFVHAIEPGAAGLTGQQAFAVSTDR